MCIDWADKNRFMVVHADLQALGCTGEPSLLLGTCDAAMSKVGVCICREKYRLDGFWTNCLKVVGWHPYIQCQ